MYLSDEDILTYLKVKGQQEYAFNQLVKKYQEKVYWQVRRMIIDHDETNDLVQDVFIKIWQKIQKFRGDSKLYTWIYRIAVNETLNYLNKKKKRFFMPLSDMEEKLSGKIDDPRHFSGSDIQKRLQKAILQLPEKQRIVFNMRYFEEKPYDEISDILQTSVGALKASYHHAVKKIEKLIFIEN